MDARPFKGPNDAHHDLPYLETTTGIVALSWYLYMTSHRSDWLGRVLAS